MEKNNLNLKNIKRKCLQTILNLSKSVNAGHIGSSLSCLDILIYLFFNQMTENDEFVLSKGHAALALYTVLEEKGIIKKSQLNSFYQNGTHFAAHPPCNSRVRGIRFGTGSLGHGLSLATGLALSSKFISNKFNVYCVLSDGDFNEGSTWEALMFIGHHKISNLTIIVDRNGLQAFGKTDEVLNIEPLNKKIEDFGFNVETADCGNDFTSLDKAFNNHKTKKPSKPKCIIAKTKKGSGISFMENKLEWHYFPMDDEQYKKALSESENI